MTTCRNKTLKVHHQLSWSLVDTAVSNDMELVHRVKAINLNRNIILLNKKSDRLVHYMDTSSNRDTYSRQEFSKYITKIYT